MTTTAAKNEWHLAIAEAAAENGIALVMRAKGEGSVAAWGNLFVRYPPLGFPAQL